MLSLRTNRERPIAACNDNGHVSAALNRESPTFLNLLAVAHNGRGLTLTYVADGVLMISKGIVDSARGCFPLHQHTECRRDVRQFA